MNIKDFNMPQHFKRFPDDSPKVLSWKLRRCHRILIRSIEKRVVSTGVYSSQHRILMTLHHEPNISQSEIAERMNISPASVAVTLKKLEKSGYIKRTVDEKDNRINNIILTEQGQEVVEKSHVIFDEIEASTFKNFTPEEKEMAGRILDKIGANLLEYYKSIEEE